MLKNILRVCLFAVALGCGGEDDGDGSCQATVDLYDECSQSCQCRNDGVCSDNICIPAS